MSPARTPLPSLVRLALLVLVACAALAEPAEAAVKKMFVTSVSGSTNLSTWPAAQGQTGLAAGDQICRTLAQNAALPNFSTYRAWLSTPSQDAYCRVAGHSGQRGSNCGQASLPDGGPWSRADGTPFARSLTELTDAFALLHAPMVNESGAPVPSGTVHTGTSPNGSAWPDGSCTSWTAGAGGFGRIGSQHTGGLWWTSNGNATCGWTARLYCFEPGSGDPLPTFETPGALVFLSSVNGPGDLGSWPDAGAATGLAAGDAICRSRAVAAGLPSPQTFVAWLSNDNVDAIDRLTTNGPFKRLDGVRVAVSKADLVDASVGNYQIETAITVTDLGTYVGSFTFTGSASTGVGVAENCNGWTSGDAADDAWRGYSQETRGFWTTGIAAVACSSSHYLYCFSNVVTIFWDGFETSDTSRWSSTAP